MAGAGGGKVERGRPAKSARADDGDRRSAQLCNAWPADFLQEDVAPVPVKIFRGEAHGRALNAVDESEFSRTRI